MIHRIYLMLASIASVANAIRVDFNTNTGPIVLPTPTIPPVPKLPYSNPAPVWESAENDIPNPHPYHYILPPPSRARPATDNYARAPISKLLNYDYYQPMRQTNYGEFIAPNLNSLPHDVPALGVEYFPNKGLKYFGLVPTSGKIHNSKDSDVFGKYDKLNGKYNAKLKKYKAYEKAKKFNYKKYNSQTKEPFFYKTTQEPFLQTTQYPELNDYEIQRSPRHIPTLRPSNTDIYFRPQNVWRSQLTLRR